MSYDWGVLWVLIIFAVFASFSISAIVLLVIFLQKKRTDFLARRRTQGPERQSEEEVRISSTEDDLLEQSAKTGIF